MAGKDNLKTPSSAEARSNGRKGGIASGEKRREKKAMKETLETLLKMPLEAGKAVDLERIKSIAAIKGKNITVQEAIMLAQIKKAIISGQLKGGESLPSMRALAAELRVSLITTKRAYEELEKSGYIETFTGKGSFVKSKKIESLREEYQIQSAGFQSIDDNMKCEDGQCSGVQYSSLQSNNRELVYPEIAMSIYEALNSPTEMSDFDNSVGRIAGEAVCIYPPGINLVNPGEVITEGVVNALKAGLKDGLEILGMSEDLQIRCLKNI